MCLGGGEEDLRKNWMHVNGQALGGSEMWFGIKLKTWSLSLLAVIESWLCPVQLRDFGQLPPSRSQYPHLEIYIENLMYLVSSRMHFIYDEKAR